MQVKVSRFASLVVSSAVFLSAGTLAMAQGQNSPGSHGAQVFATNCSGCHGADGTGGKAPNITGANIASKPDAELMKIVHDGTAAGMPSFAQLGDPSIAAVVGYLRTLQGMGNTAATPVTGDPAAGRALFFGKAQCSSCHMIQGQGGFIASELTVYGRTHSASEIEQAIVTPDAQLPPQDRAVEVVTKSGQRLTGMIRNEDNFNIVLQTEDGRYHNFSRSDLANVNYSDHSLMPQDYGMRLTPTERNNIASFLIVTGRTAQLEPEAPRRRRGGI